MRLGHAGLGEVIALREGWLVMWSHSHTLIYWFSDILTFGLGYVCVSVLLLYLFSVYFAIQTWEGITETIFDYVLYYISYG